MPYTDPIPLYETLDDLSWDDQDISDLTRALMFDADGLPVGHDDIESGFATSFSGGSL